MSSSNSKLPASASADFLKLQKLIVSKQFAQAEGPARSAAKKFPRVPIVQMLLGIALAEQLKVDEALKQFEKVARLQPDNPDVWRNIALLERRKKNYEPAKMALKKAISLNPNFGEAYLTLGEVYDSLAEQDDALAAYYKAVELMPKSPPAYNNLLIQLEITNDTAAMETVLEQARQNIPGNIVVSYFEGLLAQRKGDLAGARKWLESVCFDLPPFQSRVLEIGRTSNLGRICDKLADYPTAFRYFTKCKRLLAQNATELGYESTTYLKTISRTLGYIEGKQYEDWVTYNLPNEFDPVFLVGFPRSGTTLLDTILRSHPGIEVVEEGPAVRDMLRALAAMNPDRDAALRDMTAKQASKLREVYFSTLHKGVADTGKVIIDKLPLNLLHTVVICRVFPNARFILTLRHPADSVLSNFMQAYDQNRAMAVMNKLSSAAQYYDLVMRIWDASLPLIGDNFVESRYEDLVEDMQKTLTPVLALLGLEWDENMENYRQTALERGRIRTPSYNQVVKPLYKDAQQRWKHYAKPMAGILPLLAPWAERFGYGKLSD